MEASDWILFIDCTDNKSLDWYLWFSQRFWSYRDLSSMQSGLTSQIGQSWGPLDVLEKNKSQHVIRCQ